MKDEVKIVDFGLAKMSSVIEPVSVGGPLQPNLSHKLTRATTVFGTPVYIAPEQAKASQAVDKRADIYSLGAMLHEMASGKWVFEPDAELKDQRAIASNLMAKHMALPPPRLRAVVPRHEDIPEAFEALVLRCLEKEPDKRYQSMDEVLDALIKIQDEYVVKNPSQPGPTSSVPPVPTLNRKFLYAATAGGLALAAGLVGFLIYSRSGPKPSGSDVGGDVTPSASASTSNLSPVVKKSVVLSVDPPSAHVFQGDQELDKPVLIEVEQGKPVELEVRLEGYISQKVILDGSQNPWYA
jgi:serine/threonine-protein kinase